MKIRKHTQYIRTQSLPHRIQYTLHLDTMSDEVGQTQKVNSEY